MPNFSVIPTYFPTTNDTNFFIDSFFLLPKAESLLALTQGIALCSGFHAFHRHERVIAKT
jgi:hypothetical protein